MFALAPQGKRHVVLHGHRVEQRRALEDHSELGAHLEQLPFVQAHNVFAVNEHRAAVGPEQGDEVLEQHTLAAAAAPNDHHGFAPFNPQADTIQDEVVAEALFQIPDLDHNWNMNAIFSSTSVRKKLEMRMEMDA